MLAPAGIVSAPAEGVYSLFGISKDRFFLCPVSYGSRLSKNTEHQTARVTVEYVADESVFDYNDFESICMNAAIRDDEELECEGFSEDLENAKPFSYKDISGQVQR